MIQLFQLRFLIILNTQYRVAFRAIVLVLVRVVDRHHARTTCCDVWVVHWCQLHARLIVDFTLADIRTVQNVVFIVETH